MFSGPVLRLWRIAQVFLAKPIVSRAEPAQLELDQIELS